MLLANVYADFSNYNYCKHSQWPLQQYKTDMYIYFGGKMDVFRKDIKLYACYDACIVLYFSRSNMHKLTV